MRRVAVLSLLVALVGTPALAGSMLQNFPARGTVQGTDLIPIIPSGVTTLQSATAAGLLTYIQGQGISTPATLAGYPGDFFTDFGARASFLNDRVFIGAATKNTGAFGNNGDWLGAYGGSAAVSSSFSIGQNCQLCVETTNGLIAGVFGTQGLHAQAAATPLLGVSSYCENDHPTFGMTCWGGYFESAARVNNVGSNNFGVEIDTVNAANTTLTAPTPYAQYPANFLINLQFGCGGAITVVGKCSAGINFANNDNKYQVGINFDANAIDGDNGTTGIGNAIEFARGHAIVWFDPGNGAAAFITSLASTHINAPAQEFIDGGVNFINGAGATAVQIQTTASAVNNLNVFGGATTVAPGLSVSGSDTNIGLGLFTKGTGVITVNAPMVATGYLRPGQVLFTALSTADPSPQVGDLLNITDASACTVNVAVSAGGGTTHSCSTAYNGVGWMALVTH
jgi:hypothetical protein